MYSLFVSALPKTLRVAICEDGVLEGYHHIPRDEDAYLGTIFLARVQKVLPGIGAAIVNLGQQGEAFLNWGKGSIAVVDGGVPRLVKRLKEGQAVLAQWTKPPIREKLAVLQGELKFTGFYVIYLPWGQGIRFSRDFSGDRSALSQVLELDSGGLIIRSAASASDPALIQAEIDHLKQHFDHLLPALESGIARGLYTPNPLLSLITDKPIESWRSIYQDDESLHQELQALIQRQCPKLLPAVKLHLGNQTLFDTYKLEDALDDLHKSVLHLKSGGSIDIHQSEAMVTIDVNTGRNTQDKAGMSAGLRTNLEAVELIAHQIRVRQLAGLIVIDFVNARDKDWRKRLNQALKSALKKDAKAIDLVGVNELGVATLARQRADLDINHSFNEPCPRCRGKGWVATCKSIGIDIQTAILRDGISFTNEHLILQAGRELFHYLQDHQEVLFEVLCRQFSIKLSLQRVHQKPSRFWEIVPAD